ncbi:MAG: hypothetical protein GEU75_02635 [Dehalococcoidia bacterium]|nr:hypothetical protein [Dehalococcoidia bacterium]
MPRDYHILSLDDAEKMVRAAVEHVKAQGLPPMAVVVVDRAGEILSGSRMDTVHPRYFNAAHRKAYSGAIFERSTPGMNEMWSRQQGEGHKGPSDWNDSMLTTLPGGLCVTNDEDGRPQVVGGIGVAGDEEADEVAIAVIAVQALGQHFHYK